MCDRNILENFLDTQGRLKTLPVKRKKKIYVLAYLAEKFEPGRIYTEREVNALLNQWHLFHDPATLRRELYDNHFLNRTQNGGSYWLEEPQPAFLQTE